eukprot:CAMPEP_0180648640 /NCGR_PEP_ID=MMETSP1037_2-20121125/51092_1 /TAXON_ID=632150 /ORGANISM="Azadinium spinosum, Strain 3D9" /LENGTH=220 /DNA_ID=CAMNT_0022673501 /DNA_START=20 /DNA_END=682 /DNA_ORIENTATION=+
MSEYLDCLEESERLGESPQCYMGKVRLNDGAPELIADIELSPASPHAKFGACFGENLQGVHTYFGSGWNTTGVHCDPGENLLIVICGSKRFDLFPPTDLDCLYPARQPGYLCSQVPPLIPPEEMPSELKRRCPLYRHAQPLHAELEAGDMLYLPPFWWHGVAGGVERNMILNWWCELHPHKVEITPESEGASAILAGLARSFGMPPEAAMVDPAMVDLSR